MDQAIKSTQLLYRAQQRVKIVVSKLLQAGTSRWETSTAYPGGNADNNRFTQFAADSNFKLDGVEVSRTTNSITDLIQGVTIDLKADDAGSVQYTAARSEASVKATVEKVISTLNDYKKELDRLTYIDVEGDDNGPLAMDPAVGRLKSQLKALTITALKGHADKDIYLSNLGIKTNSSGEYFFDKVTFGKTYTDNPEYFSALKDDNVSTSVVTASATKSQFTKIPSGTYEVTYDAGSSTWKFGTTEFNQNLIIMVEVDLLLSPYPGLVIDTTDANPSAFNVFVGKSFSQSMVDLTESILSSSSSIKTAETAYRTSNTDVAKKLADLETKRKITYNPLYYSVWRYGTVYVTVQ